MKRLIGWWLAAIAAGLLAVPAAAQEQPGSNGAVPVNTETTQRGDGIAPLLRERKMTEEELFAHRNGWTSTEAPAFAHAGARSVGPGDRGAGTAVAAGKVVDAEALRRLSPARLESFVAQRRDYLLELREQVGEGVEQLRDAMEGQHELDPGVDATYADLFRAVEAMENEVANIEAAHSELEQFDELDLLVDMEKRLKRARVHLRMMERSESLKEFENYAGILATALGIIEQQSEALASR